jgi:hypothetical protein
MEGVIQGSKTPQPPMFTKNLISIQLSKARMVAYRRELCHNYRFYNCVYRDFRFQKLLGAQMLPSRELQSNTIALRSALWVLPEFKERIVEGMR